MNTHTHTHTHTHTWTHTHTHTHTQPDYFVQVFDCGSDCGPQHPVRLTQMVLLSALVVVWLAQLQTVSTQAQRVSNAYPLDTKASFEQKDPNTLIKVKKQAICCDKTQHVTFWEFRPLFQARTLHLSIKWWKLRPKQQLNSENWDTNIS